MRDVDDAHHDSVIEDLIDHPEFTRRAEYRPSS
jgi:hypothetical protein